MNEIVIRVLVGAPRDVAFDAVVAGTPSPFVLVGDRMACSGSVDVAAVVAAIERARADAPA